MSNLINLNKRQKLHILTGSVLSCFLLLASISMYQIYKQLEQSILFGGDLQLTIWTIVGWCLLMYFGYAIASCIIECTWTQSDTSLSYSDATLELTDIKSSLRNETQILHYLNYISNNSIKEISLIYDLSSLFKTDQEKVQIMKDLKHQRAINKRTPQETSLNLDPQICRSLCDLIKKVLKIAEFKKRFKNNPEEFFKSRRLFVTFKSHRDAWAFKTLYNRAYKFRISNILSRKPDNYNSTKIITHPQNDISLNIKQEFVSMNKGKVELEDLTRVTQEELDQLNSQCTSNQIYIGTNT